MMKTAQTGLIKGYYELTTLPSTAKRVVGKGSTQIRVMRDDTLRFRYELKLHSPGDYFECSLFSEIGEPYKAQMRELMAEFNLVLGTPKELPERPWFADTLGSISQ